jgi:4-amino-4-deoxy-L-arabinose transferase-like glycosyltransferase
LFPETTGRAGPDDAARAWSWTLALVGVLTLVRLLGLFLSPVELYPEEAQYWLWSRHLHLGYFSKPPMIAWAIWATTRLGGGEAFVRLVAPLAHAAAALMLARAGRRLYGGWTGFWAAVVYSLAPGVQLSAAVVATDCLVMAASSLAVWSYAAWLTSGDTRGRLGWSAALGVALGLGALSKYAILYVVLGLLLHAAVSPATRRRWRPAEVGAVVGLAMLVLAPNLLWNAAHGFQTVAHTAHDAAWSGGVGHARAAPHASVLNARAAPGFLLAQLGVFGPIPFGVLVAGGAALIFRRAGSPADLALGSLAAPALLLILAESIIARANANWAAVAYVPGSILVAAWLSRWRGRFWRGRLWLGLTAASEGLLLLAFLGAAVSPALANRMGAANSFKRARGWEETARLVTDAARRLGPAKLSAIAVDDRFTYNALSYYARGDWPAAAPPLTMWVRKSRPGNEAETVAPLSRGARVLFADIGEGRPGPYRAEAARDFVRVEPLGAWKVWMDSRHYREVFLFLGEGYDRRPRDPRTGLPIPA